ncbi:MAG: hypothetical protein LBC52_01045 [Treponema sp.]|nr:hypothetical protein [Treponema sp.]
MTIWPNNDQWVKVSYNTRPVTQAALVAVKRASSGGVHPPEREAAGRQSKNPPNSINAENVIVITCVYVSFN